MSAVEQDLRDDWQSPLEAQMYLNALSDECDRCAPFIKAALDNSAQSHHWEDVKEMIMTGAATLWSTDDGAVVTCFTTFPASKMLQLWLMGGDYKQVLNERYASIELWAKANGCDQMFVNGRKGWERRLAPLGYKFASVVLSKEI